MQAMRNPDYFADNPVRGQRSRAKSAKDSRISRMKIGGHSTNSAAERLVLVR